MLLAVFWLFFCFLMVLVVQARRRQHDSSQLSDGSSRQVRLSLSLSPCLCLHFFVSVSHSLLFCMQSQGRRQLLREDAALSAVRQTRGQGKTAQQMQERRLRMLCFLVCVCVPNVLCAVRCQVPEGRLEGAQAGVCGC